MTFLLIAGLLGAVVVISTCAVWWRVAAKSLFFIAVFEGAIRKWLIPSGSELFYFLKDGVLIGALIGWAVAQRNASRRPVHFFWFVFGSAALFGVVEIFHPTMASPVVGALGWKAYFLWAGLVLIVPDALQTMPELVRYLRSILIVAIPVCSLAVAQFQLPPSHFLNVYAWEGATVHEFTESGNVRVTGTFSFLTGYTSFLSALAVVMTPLLLFVRLRSVRWPVYALGPLLAGTALMSGGRSIVFFLGIFLAIFVPLGVVTRVIEPARLARSFIIPAAIVALAVVGLFGKAREAFALRTAGAERVGDTFVVRTLGVTLGAFDSSVFSYFGDGIGSENNAGRIAGGMVGWPSFAPPRAVEAEPNRVMAEIGLFGWILWYGCKLGVIVVAWRVFLQMQTPLGRGLALSAFCYLGINIISPLPFDQILAVFYWFIVGMVFGLPHWETTTPRTRSARQMSAAT